MSKRKNLKIDIELGTDGGYWGLTEEHNGWQATGYGDTVEQVFDDVWDCIEDHVEHEGKGDKYWSSLKRDNSIFEISYSLGAFFERYKDLNIKAFAERAGMNYDQLRHYKNGTKKVTRNAADRIELAIKDLVKDLGDVQLHES